MLLLRGGWAARTGLVETESEDVLVTDIRRLLTSESSWASDCEVRSMMLCRLSNEVGEIDRRFCGTSTTEGFPEKMTDTTLAVTSWLLLSFAGEGQTSSLLESYSKSEKSPAVEDASSSEDMYSSWGVCVKLGGSGIVNLRPTRLSSSRDARRALFWGRTGA